MRKRLCFFIFILFLFAQEIEASPIYPFSISGHYLNANKADVDDFDGTLKYTEWDAALCYTHPLCDFWDLMFGAGYVGTVVELRENPEFQETFFSYSNFSFGASTKIFPCWTLNATLSLFFDNDFFSLMDYTLYEGVIMGKYDFSERFDFNIGLITEYGLKKIKLWPIIGFHYSLSPKCNLFVIYPIKIALEYDLFCHLQLGTSVRFLRTRHRLNQDEFNSQGIFEYYSNGAEVDLAYFPYRWFWIKGYVGGTFAGNLKIFNRNYSLINDFKFDSSFYAGVSGLLSY